MDVAWFFGQGIGWLGVAFGLLVAPPQLYKIIKHKRTKNISIMTYGFLILTMTCYLLHAIYITDWPFITSNSINLSVNGTIFILLIIDRRRYIKNLEESDGKGKVGKVSR